MLRKLSEETNNTSQSAMKAIENENENEYDFIALVLIEIGHVFFLEKKNMNQSNPSQKTHTNK